MEIKGIMIVNKISSQQVKKQFYAENVTMINAGYALVKLTFLGLVSHLLDHIQLFQKRLSSKNLKP